MKRWCVWIITLDDMVATCAKRKEREREREERRGEKRRGEERREEERE